MPTETLRPNAVGDVTQLTAYPGPPNWACVDEAVSDGDATRVGSPKVYAWYRDLYNLPDPSLVGPGDTINSVTVYINCRRTGSAGSCRTGLKTRGAEYNGAIQSPPTTYTTYSTTYLTNPAGGAWTYTDLQALQIGVGLRTDIELTGPVYCTQVWVVIDYTVAVVAVPQTIGDGLTWVVNLLGRNPIKDKGGTKTWEKTHQFVSTSSASWIRQTLA